MFGKKYKMKKKYDISMLYAGKLKYKSSEYISDKKMDNKDDLSFIFERIIENKQVKYREVFTGMLVDKNSECLDLPYITDIIPLATYYSNGIIDNYELLRILNDINNNLENKKEKVKVLI